MKNLYVNTLYGMFLFITTSCVSGSSDYSKVLTAEEYAMAISTDTTAVVLDVRTPEEYALGHISGARLMNVGEEEEFVNSADTLDTSRTYYIYCRSGRRSRKAAILMLERGLRVVDLKGGYNAWVERDSTAEHVVE